MISALTRIIRHHLNRRETVLEAVIKTSFINSVARLFGYARTLAIAILLGLNYRTDGFFMAVSLAGIFLIFADVFDSIGVPELVRARLKSKEAFERLSGLLLTLTTTLALTIGLLALLFTPIILKIPSGFNSEALEITRTSYLLLIPYIVLNFFFHYFGAVLRSDRKFTPYFLGEFLLTFFNFLFTLSGLLLTKDYRVLPLSLSLSQLTATLYMLIIARNYLHFHFYVDETTKKILKHFFQLVLLYSVFHLYVLVDRAFASYLGEKSISALTYGLTIAGAIKGILKFENIAITSLAEVGGSIEKLNFYVRRLFLLLVPIKVFFFLLPWLPVKLLFGYGSVTKVDIDLTAEALKYYSLSLFFMFLWPLLYRVFQIREKLPIIGIISIFGVILNALLNYLFIFKLKLAITGICLGTFFSYLLICSTGYVILYYIDKKSKANSP